MPGTILGLDIDDDSVTAVKVKSGLKGVQVTACARVPVEGGGLDQALKGLVDRMDLKSDLCVSSISGKYASYRNIQMPFKDRKKIGQTLAFEIEQMVPFPVEDLVVDFAVVDISGQSDILAVSVKREYVSELLRLITNYHMMT